MLKLLRLLAQKSLSALLLTVVFGIASGVCSAWLIKLMTGGIYALKTLQERLWVFGISAFALAVASYITRRILLIMSRDAVNDLRLGLCAAIQKAPLRSLDAIGNARLLATLTEDVLIISDSLVIIPIICVELAVLLACLAALVWLSPILCLGLVCCLTIGVVTHALITRRTEPYLRQGRDLWDSLIGLYQDLLQGNKELKLNGRGRAIFWQQHLEPTALAMQALSFKWHHLFAVAGVFGQIFYFLAIGVVLFLGPILGQSDPMVLSAFTFMTFFLSGPIGALVDAVPKCRRAAVALQRIDDINLNIPADKNLTVSTLVLNNCRKLVIQNLEFHYSSLLNTAKNFTVGPISHTFCAGKVTFIVGENGSGKSSLVKLLCGIYAPSTGTVKILDDHSQQLVEGPSELFAVAFSDFHLFRHQHGFLPTEEKSAQHYLKLLGLKDKVSLENKSFSTVDLSAGQRRRLAMVTALVQDRPIYIFDEWASDQDPEFKDFFYTKLLGELKNRGKIVIVVSHDRSYFSVADSLLHLHGGTEKKIVLKHARRQL